MAAEGKPLPPAPASETASPVPSRPSNAKQVQVHDTAHVADKASLIPDQPLTIGAQCVLHPFSKVDASHGPVAIGDQCVLWEKTLVGAVPASSETVEASDELATVIGRLVTISPHAVVEAGARIGDGVTLGPLSRVGRGANIGAGASVTATGSVPAGTQVPAGAVVGVEGQIVRVRQTQHISDDVIADLDKAREIKDVGEARHRGLMRKLVKGQAGGTGRVG